MSRYPTGYLLALLFLCRCDGLFLCLACDLFQLVPLVASGGHIGGVADQNDAFALIGKIAEDLHNFVLGFLVQVAGRLVSKDNIGIIGQRTGDGHALLLPIPIIPPKPSIPPGIPPGKPEEPELLSVVTGSKFSEPSK